MHEFVRLFQACIILGVIHVGLMYWFDAKRSRRHHRRDRSEILAKK